MSVFQNAIRTRGVNAGSAVRRLDREDVSFPARRHRDLRQAYSMRRLIVKVGFLVEFRFSPGTILTDDSSYRSRTTPPVNAVWRSDTQAARGSVSEDPESGNPWRAGKITRWVIPRVLWNDEWVWATVTDWQGQLVRDERSGMLSKGIMIPSSRFAPPAEANRALGHRCRPLKVTAYHIDAPCPILLAH